MSVLLGHIALFLMFGGCWNEHLATCRDDEKNRPSRQHPIPCRLQGFQCIPYAKKWQGKLLVFFFYKLRKVTKKNVF
jgi:hypothetical protein